MADLLTDNVLPVLGLCPPGSLLLPWLSHARAATGRLLELPQRTVAATFAVAKRVTRRTAQQDGGGAAPVAAVLLEEAPGKDGRGTGILGMLDWAAELSPGSAAALRKADPKAIFGIDLPVRRRCLLVVTEDDTLPQGLLRELTRRMDLGSEELGWLGLRSLLEVLQDYLGRTPRDRWRAPERTAAELVARLQRHGIRSVGPRPVPPPGLQLAGLWPGKRRYEPLRPGSREFPYRFAVNDALCNEAMVLSAQLHRRKAIRPLPSRPGKAGARTGSEKK